MHIECDFEQQVLGAVHVVDAEENKARLPARRPMLQLIPSGCGPVRVLSDRVRQRRENQRSWLKALLDLLPRYQVSRKRRADSQVHPMPRDWSACQDPDEYLELSVGEMCQDVIELSLAFVMSLRLYVIYVSALFLRQTDFK